MDHFESIFFNFKSEQDYLIIYIHTLDCQIFDIGCKLKFDRFESQKAIFEEYYYKNISTNIYEYDISCGILYKNQYKNNVLIFSKIIKSEDTHKLSDKKTDHNNNRIIIPCKNFISFATFTMMLGDDITKRKVPDGIKLDDLNYVSFPSNHRIFFNCYSHREKLPSGSKFYVIIFKGNNQLTHYKTYGIKKSLHNILESEEIKCVDNVVIKPCLKFDRLVLPNYLMFKHIIFNKNYHNKETILTFNGLNNTAVITIDSPYIVLIGEKPFDKLHICKLFLIVFDWKKMQIYRIIDLKYWKTCNCHAPNNIFINGFPIDQNIEQNNFLDKLTNVAKSSENLGNNPFRYHSCGNNTIVYQTDKLYKYDIFTNKVTCIGEPLPLNQLIFITKSGTILVTLVGYYKNKYNYECCYMNI